MEMEIKVNPACPNCMELWQQNKELQRKILLLENKIVEVEGWKGKDNIEVFREGETWIIIEHRKDKKTGDIAEQKKKVAHQNVAVVWNIIKRLCPVKNIDKTNYRGVVPELIKYYNLLDVDVDSFNGGKHRSKYLFPLYYYPLKVLELHYKAIEYGGSGDILRLK